MTWAERFGDLATNVALVLINAVRIVTLPLKLAAIAVDGIVTTLSEKGEDGIKPTNKAGTTSWIGLPAAVLWGVAAITLRTLSIVTVLVRQLATTVDDYMRILAEGK
jgi:hypothetical protein